MRQEKERSRTNASAVLARTRSLYSSLTPSEAAVAKVLLEHPTEVVRLSVEALAQRAGMSTTTVMRFCQTLGFEGFKELKITLASEVGGKLAILPEDIKKGDSPKQIAAKVFEADIQAIRQTLELLNDEILGNAVETLDRARKIEIYGIGSSAPIATDAYYRFLRIGLPASVITDSHMQAVSAGLLSMEDVALVISHTGRTSETLSAARNAKAGGATVVCLTSFSRTPLTALADISLITATGETAFRVEAMASRIAHLSVIDALYVAIATRRFADAHAVLERTNRIIEQKRL